MNSRNNLTCARITTTFKREVDASKSVLKHNTVRHVTKSRTETDDAELLVINNNNIFELTVTAGMKGRHGSLTCS